jgi:hypothetical protein
MIANAARAKSANEYADVAEQIDDNPKHYSAEIRHPARNRPILRLSPTGWNLRHGRAKAGLPSPLLRLETVTLAYLRLRTPGGRIGTFGQKLEKRA